MEMAPIILVYLFYSMVGMAHLAPIDGELQEFFVHHRVKRAKVELPLDIFDVTRWHNYFRRKPIASDMEHVHHSQVLADRALWWARKCRFDYVPPEDHRARGDILRTTLSPLFATYGQNIYHTSKLLGDNELIREALSSWYDESRVYLPDDATCLIGSCRLYKQLMWASVQAVGCAAIRCDRLRDPFGNNYANELFLVCNYNRQQSDGLAYQPGYRCSNCSQEEPVAKCDEGLCRRDGIGSVISQSADIVFDPLDRRVTEKARTPTLPPDIRAIIESSKRHNGTGFQPVPVSHSTSLPLSRSDASRTTSLPTAAGRSTTSQSTRLSSTASSHLPVENLAARTPFPSNSPNARTSSPSTAQFSRSTMPTPEARTRTAASGEAPAILVADRSKANDPVTRSIPAPVNSVAGRSTVLPMAYGANAKKYNELNEPSFDKKGFGRSSSDTVHRS